MGGLFKGEERGYLAVMLAHRIEDTVPLKTLLRQAIKAASRRVTTYRLMPSVSPLSGLHGD
jgi:hypothetical protein